MLQLHLNDQQFYCLLRRILYYRFDGRWYTIIWNSTGLDYWCIYASLNLDELTHSCQRWISPAVAFYIISSQQKCKHILTHWGQDKMAAILQTTFSNAFFLMETFEFQIQFLFKRFPYGQIDKMSALVQMVAWSRTGDKALSDPMMTQFTDEYMHH